MSKEKWEGEEKSGGGNNSSKSPKNSSKFVPEIKPCQQQFRVNAFVSTL